MPRTAEPPLYEYTIAPLFPDRLGRRWRWTLSHDGLLLAAGWRHGERLALQALRTAAARAAHEALGLSTLRPDRVWSGARFAAGMTVRLEAGAVACVLAPRPMLVPAW